MAQDAKYGRVTLQHGSIADDEPVFVLRAQDRLTPEVLTAYRGMCQTAGSSPFHLSQISQAQETISTWQKDHTDIVDTPNSASFEARVTG